MSASNAADVKAPYAVYYLLFLNRWNGQMWVREYTIPLAKPGLTNLRDGEVVWCRDYEANNRSAYDPRQFNSLESARKDWERMVEVYNSPNKDGWFCSLLSPHLLHCVFNATNENRELQIGRAHV